MSAGTSPMLNAQDTTGEVAGCRDAWLRDQDGRRQLHEMACPLRRSAAWRGTNMRFSPSRLPREIRVILSAGAVIPPPVMERVAVRSCTPSFLRLRYSENPRPEQRASEWVGVWSCRNPHLSRSRLGCGDRPIPCAHSGSRQTGQWSLFAPSTDPSGSPETPWRRDRAAEGLQVFWVGDAGLRYWVVAWSMDCLVRD